MQPCALKNHLEYVAIQKRCRSCNGSSTNRCYLSGQELKEQKEFFYKMFLHEFEMDDGRLTDMLEEYHDALKGELSLW